MNLRRCLHVCFWNTCPVSSRHTGRPTRNIGRRSSPPPDKSAIRIRRDRCDEIATGSLGRVAVPDTKPLLLTKGLKRPVIDTDRIDFNGTSLNGRGCHSKSSLLPSDARHASSSVSLEKCSEQRTRFIDIRRTPTTTAWNKFPIVHYANKLYVPLLLFLLFSFFLSFSRSSEGAANFEREDFRESFPIDELQDMEFVRSLFRNL